MLKILFITKRYYMSKDLIKDRYGRFYELPLYLSMHGHEVHLVCHSYRKDKPLSLKVNDRFSVSSWSLGLNPLSGLARHYHKLEQIILKDKPDLIIAASDCFQIILASRLARKYSIPLVADLYDNFLSYPASRLPGVASLFARALRQADLVTVVSSELAKLIASDKKIHHPVKVIVNGVTSCFAKHPDRMEARKKYGFESNQYVIGTAGSLHTDKGIAILIETFIELAAERPELRLVLAGPGKHGLSLPDSPVVSYLGNLPHQEIPLLFSALDLGVICIQNTAFGKYCFPQKFYEMVACKLPMVASAVGEMVFLMKGYPELLFKPDSREQLKHAIRYQIQHAITLPVSVPTWEDQAARLDQLIKENFDNSKHTAG